MPRDRAERALPLEERRWAENAEIYAGYDSGRKIFRPATSKVVASVLERYIPKNARVIEIGSGIGELVYSLLPSNSPYRQIIEQTEYAQAAVEQQKRRHPDANIRQANVYSLPYPDNSIDTVLGFASFDTLADPQAAIAEMSRVLSEGGRIIHMLDLEASAHTFFHNYDYAADSRIPFPMAGEKPGSSPGVVLVTQQQLERAITRLQSQPELAPIVNALRRYADDPEENFDLLSTMQDGLGEFAIMVKQLVLGDEQAETIRFNEYFTNRWKVALEEQGFEIEELGVEEGTALINRTAITDPTLARFFIGRNVAVSDVGTVYGQNDLNIPDGQVKAVSRINVLVARKPETIKPVEPQKPSKRRSIWDFLNRR